MLERKASIGPCFRPKTSSGVPSGISLCIPKKSNRTVDENVTNMQSIINISVSKKCLANRSRSTIDCDRKGGTGEGSSKTKKRTADIVKSKTESKHEGTTNEGSSEIQVEGVRVTTLTTLGLLKGKINAITGKIKSILKV
ncbi:hypothetical protein K1T71_007918 [Dendrolimus kikuchii]|uniref:Uncharacterized protein n=1 Tax=Dendrolimus kikuchii TaxID=765133 RepID=A0ACC1CZ43_9NEOP|nr:hypothetical protein K1T71_007918 [Dendrolimus kikuchii]